MYVIALRANFVKINVKIRHFEDMSDLNSNAENLNFWRFSTQQHRLTNNFN